jgi:hypothetical protein
MDGRRSLVKAARALSQEPNLKAEKRHMKLDNSVGTRGKMEHSFL